MQIYTEITVPLPINTFEIKIDAVYIIRLKLGKFNFKTRNNDIGA